MKFPFRVIAAVDDTDKAYAVQVLTRQVGAEADGSFGVQCSKSGGGTAWLMSSLSTERDADAVVWFQTSAQNPNPKIASLQYVVFDVATGQIVNSSGGPLAGLSSPFQGVPVFLSALGLTLV